MFALDNQIQFIISVTGHIPEQNSINIMYPRFLHQYSIHMFIESSFSHFQPKLLSEYFSEKNLILKKKINKK